MVCGTPVPATSVGGVPDLIKNGKTGFILEDNLPECIVENVIMASNQQNLNKIAENARKLIKYKIIEKDYTYAAAVGRHIKILDNF